MLARQAPGDYRALKLEGTSVAARHHGQCRSTPVVPRQARRPLVYPRCAGSSHARAGEGIYSNSSESGTCTHHPPSPLAPPSLLASALAARAAIAARIRPRRPRRLAALPSPRTSPIRAEARCAPSTNRGEVGERSETGGGCAGRPAEESR